MATLATQVPLDSTLTLVARARAGDRVALESIVDRYQPALMRFAHGRVPGPVRGLLESADIVQVAMLHTIARLDRIDPRRPGSLLAYLRCAVLNQIRDEIRRAHRRPQAVDLDEALPGFDPDPLEQVISEEERQRYDMALTQLPPEYQEAFLMRIEMDCGYREIAEALGKPSAEAARMIVRRAVLMMARLLKLKRGA